MERGVDRIIHVLRVHVYIVEFYMPCNNYHNVMCCVMHAKLRRYQHTILHISYFVIQIIVDRVRLMHLRLCVYMYRSIILHAIVNTSI